MHIVEVLSHFNGWHILNSFHKAEYDDLVQTLKIIQFEPTQKVGLRDLSKGIVKSFEAKEWNVEVFIENGRMRKHIDCIKAGVGVELGFGKMQFTFYDLYAKFPIFTKTQKIALAVIIVPMRNFARERLQVVGVSTFEQIKNDIIEMSPLSLRYPFVIVGIDDCVEIDIHVSELTNDLDNYLISQVGYTLEECIIMGEQLHYEFKQQLPDNKKMNQEICGFANIQNGGIILIGVSDNGELIGIDNTIIDNVKLSIINSMRDTCYPPPDINFYSFDLPNGSSKIILVIQVSELAHKPCLFSDRVYIRTNNSVRPANHEEIRRMIIDG